MYLNALKRSRINRTEFFFNQMAILGVVLLACILIGAGSWLGALIAIPALIFNAVVSIHASVARLHDLNHNGWFYLLVLIPFVGLAFVIYLFFAAGTEGVNDFGAQPQ